MFKVNPFKLVDFYKIWHSYMYPAGTQYFYSHMIPRSNTYSKTKAGAVVVIGPQVFAQMWLVKYFNDNFFNLPKDQALKPFNRLITNTIGTCQLKFDELEALWELGYLPITVKAAPEGSQVSIQCPIMTFQTSDKGIELGMAWVTQYLETLCQSEIWPMVTNATDIYNLRKLFNEFAEATSDIPEFADWQLHDFSARGIPGVIAGMKVGMMHLFSSFGTDNIAAIACMEEFYGANTDVELVGSSVIALEHAVTTLNIANIVSLFQTTGVYKQYTLEQAQAALPGEDIKLQAEYIFLLELLTVTFPTGILSYVSDTNDYWGVVTKILPLLKDVIINRGDDAMGNSRLVLRPDSSPKYSSPDNIINGFKINDCTSNPDVIPGWMLERSHKEVALLSDGKYYAVLNNSITDIVVPEWEVKGTLQIQYEIFGGVPNSKGFIQIERHIGLIYGDSISYETSTLILNNMKKNNFASTNLVVGTGSFFYQGNVTRDSLGIAQKGSKAIVAGKSLELKKNPKTDPGKVSPEGWIKVEYKDPNDLSKGTTFTSNVSKEEEQQGILQVIFADGKLYNFQNHNEIKARLWPKK